MNIATYTPVSTNSPKPPCSMEGFPPDLEGGEVAQPIPVTPQNYSFCGRVYRAIPPRFRTSTVQKVAVTLCSIMGVTAIMVTAGMIISSNGKGGPATVLAGKVVSVAAKTVSAFACLGIIAYAYRRYRKSD